MTPDTTGATGGEKPKIRIFVASNWGSDLSMCAVAEDGDEIANHISSNTAWGRLDMGLDGGSRKHDLYAKKYPDGYELVWVDDWRSDPFLMAQAEKNKAAALAKAKGGGDALRCNRKFA